ncbi:hypothetical protein [Mycobacterium sp. SA01]|uniref:hypothetical protein n=1 Tax=Mycobacterium sp. SA01 TaxID=3238820 RepID=UPI00351B03E8
MEPQQTAAMELMKALNARQVQSAMAMRADGYSVILSDVHPPTTVHFGFGQFREIAVQLIFDGRQSPVRTTDPDEIADLVIAKLAGG